MNVKIFLLCLLLFTGVEAAVAQSQAMQEYDYGGLGLAFSVPSTWTHNGVVITTKADFIRQFGRTYNEPDSSSVWNAYGSFFYIDIDSSRVPAEDAYAIHRLTLSVQRSRTMYRKLLCRFGKKSLWEDVELVKADARLVSEENISSPASISQLFGNYAKAYERTTAGTNLPTIGRMYRFYMQERCYTLKIESTSQRKSQNKRLHEVIVNSLKLVK